MVAEDNGIGFGTVSDKDLHSIRERIALLGRKAGDQSSTQADPIEIRIPYTRKGNKMRLLVAEGLSMLPMHSASSCSCKRMWKRVLQAGDGQRLFTPGKHIQSILRF